MAENYRTLSKQINKIAGRLDKLENSIDHLSSSTDQYTGDDNGDNHDHDHRYCALPEVREREFAQNVSPHRERLIRYIGKKWVNGTTLRYYFFPSGPWSGPDSEMDLVRDSFQIWDDVGIGLTFEEVTAIDEAEIRIGFLDGDGAWSYVGRDVIDIPGQHERTMNFGWSIAADRRGTDVSVHEIGHTLGFPHEHQNPFSGIVWDEAAVYAYFGGSPNNWTPDQTFRNVLRKLPTATVEGSAWDPDSIMHYGFPAGLIVQPPRYQGGLTPALGLTDEDEAEVRRFYPEITNANFPALEPFRPRFLSLEPGCQANFAIEQEITREYSIRTFGNSDTVMVLFEDRDDGLHFIEGDDDSGTGLNANITTWLHKERRYVLRIRLYVNWASGDTALMMW
ncbi:MAG: matrixin family metalloprotease [Alphaproteobacteria bacterium]